MNNSSLSCEYSLRKYLNYNNGFFIEVGANDGIQQSNTLRLEKDLGWKGILIEPSFESYINCIKNRKDSLVLNIALTSFSDYQKRQFQYGDFNGSLMSSLINKKTGFNFLDNLKNILISLKNNNLVPVRQAPLQLIFDQLIFQKVDFLSLDVEGYELEVLHGINFETFRPKYIAIEVRNHHKEKIFDYLFKKQYRFLECLTNFSLTNSPRWDGTHQDYLFIDDLSDTSL